MSCKLMILACAAAIACGAPEKRATGPDPDQQYTPPPPDELRLDVPAPKTGPVPVPAPPGYIRTVDFSTSGGFNRRIMWVLFEDVVADELERCYAQLLTRSPLASGRLVLEVRGDGSGKIITARVEGVGDAAFRECVRPALLRLQYEKLGGASGAPTARWLVDLYPTELQAPPSPAPGPR